LSEERIPIIPAVITYGITIFREIPSHLSSASALPGNMELAQFHLHTEYCSARLQLGFV